MAKIEGNPKVNPDKLTVNGRPIKGWIVEQVSGNFSLRKWLELFMPGKIPDGHVARPLVYGDDLPEAGKAPPAPPAAPPSLPANVNPPAPAERPPVPPGPVTGFDPVKLAELKKTCKINQNMGVKQITIEYVLKMLA